jgi:photosystem II stability/assembly factor-like uncharacterized protein
MPASAQWIKQTVNNTASLRGLSLVNEKIVWASGTGGTVIRTIDGGKTWNVMTVPGAEKLDFRDIEAFDANTAYILSIGNGESSRIYKTTDGGEMWTEQFRNKNEKAFFDAIACWDAKNCIAMSDPVEGYFVFIETTDGMVWKDSPYELLKAKEGEAAFAASGTCLIAGRNHTFWIATGGGAARILHLRYADVWTSATPLITGTTGSGIFSIAMFDLTNGVIVGGNYEKPDDAKDNLAFTIDNGRTWRLGTGLTGYRSGVAYVDKKTIIAVGTNGSDITRDGGKTWKVLGKENLNAVQAKGRRAVWAVGPKGLVVKMK